MENAVSLAEASVEDKRPDDGKAIISVNDIYDKSSADVEEKQRTPKMTKKISWADVVRYGKNQPK